MAVKIANALECPPETVFRAAGMLPPGKKIDEVVHRIIHGHSPGCPLLLPAVDIPPYSSTIDLSEPGQGLAGLLFHPLPGSMVPARGARMCTAVQGGPGNLGLINHGVPKERKVGGKGGETEVVKVRIPIPIIFQSGPFAPGTLAFFYHFLSFSTVPRKNIPGGSVPGNAA